MNVARYLILLAACLFLAAHASIPGEAGGLQDVHLARAVFHRTETDEERQLIDLRACRKVIMGFVLFSGSLFAYNSLVNGGIPYAWHDRDVSLLDPQCFFLTLSLVVFSAIWLEAERKNLFNVVAQA